jgi:iron(III) transport system permease protein
MPPLVFSVALLMTILSIPGVLSLYNTVSLLVIAEVVVFLPYALRIVGSSIVSVSDELFEASATSGAGMFRTLRSIVAPIVGPSLINAGAIAFILSLRELGAVILIVPLNFSLMPNQIFSIWETGDFGEVNAFNVISILAMLIVLLIGLAIFGLLARGYGRFRFGHHSGAL